MRVERRPDGTPTIVVSQDEVRSGALERLGREAARRIRKEQGQVDVLEFGQEAGTSEGYQLSSEVADVVHRLVEAVPRFAHIGDYRLACALQVGKKPEGKGGMHVFARAVKAPTLWRDLGEYEVVVWANALAWAHLSERQREALVAHELSHIGPRSESGRVVMLEHDVEEFAWVVRTYGQWHSGLEHFAEQLGLGLPSGQG